ncbi:hypothetical protein GCM10023257_03640 [Streptomyces hyderabadensis]|uniref:Uncharacterized protein n=1 Tax=Streptomyces hyderabadensis TaxID=598549 RepID=A0ABP9HHP1_9ACTN
MATNADSTFLGAQATLSYLKRSRGSIVDIAAAKGLGDDRMFSAFNAAKGAVVNFMRGLPPLAPRRGAGRARWRPGVRVGRTMDPSRSRWRR